MKKTITILLLIACVSIPGCKIWDWGDTVIQTIQKGDHSPDLEFKVIESTEVWGGNCMIFYDAEEMIDTIENFSYWSKLGGLMPDIDDNFIEGKHQSARAAWRIDPEDPNYIYLGYIVYIKGEVKPFRDYLFDHNGNKVKVQVGEQFYVNVKQSPKWWGVVVRYRGQEAYIKIEDSELKREKFSVVMNLYYGGIIPAPTPVTLTMEMVDTNWNY